MSDAILYMDENRQDVIIVHVMAQRLLDPQQTDQLARHLCDLFDSGVQCVLVGLKGVQHLSSIFFRSFIMAGKKAVANQAKLAFCNLSSMIQEGFALTGLSALFPIYKSENDALKNLTEK